MTKKINIQGESGNIVGTLQLPDLADNSLCPMALILHGIYDDKDTPFIKAIADTLLAKGIGSLRIDFNGHGESDGSFLNMTVPKEIDDAKKALEYLATLGIASRITLIGHSQGGVVAGMLAGMEEDIPIDSLILLAPGACLKDDCQRGEIFGSKFNPQNIPDKVDNPWGPLGRQYLQENQKLMIYDETSKFSGPVCLIHGTADDIVPIRYSDKYAELMPNAESHRIEGTDHYFEPKQSEALAIISEFMATRYRTIQ